MVPGYGMVRKGFMKLRKHSRPPPPTQTEPCLSIPDRFWVTSVDTSLNLRSAPKDWSHPDICGLSQM